MPLPAWLPIWLTNLLGGGWLRNALGIRKDIVDTKKAKLEVKKLEREAKQQDSLITPATLEDVKKFDPKYQAIERNLRAARLSAINIIKLLFMILLAILAIVSLIRLVIVRLIK